MPPGRTFRFEKEEEQLFSGQERESVKVSLGDEGDMGKTVVY